MTCSDLPLAFILVIVFDLREIESFPMASLVDRSVPRTLFSMALPMLVGTFAMNLNNMVDSYFVSKLGTQALAAMGYTFPVIMMLGFAAGGLGMGVTTLTSHQLGRKDHAAAAALTSHGIVLTVSISVILCTLCFLLMNPIFSALGAGPDTLPLIRKFMGIWFIGGLTTSLPMMGNGLLISCGDSKLAGRLMMLGTIVNVILNPMLIFGKMGLPPMGIAGSALATVIAQFVSMSWLLYLLIRKHKLLVFKRWPIAAYMESFKKIINFSIPSILSMILGPISATVLTAIISRFGDEAIAAAGVAERIEMIAFIIPMALGMSLMPFVSQNFGAQRGDRIREAHRIAKKFALGYGLLAACAFMLLAPWFASIFTDNPKVEHVLVLYLRIICFCYGMTEVHRYNCLFCTGLHKPSRGTLLNIIRVGVLLLPLSLLGAWLFGIKGVFAARFVADICIGSFGMWLVSRMVRDLPTTKSAEPVAEAEPEPVLMPDA